MAIRVGLITGATSAGFSAAGKLPIDTTAQIAQKAIVTGAIGGLAVAAAGGDKDAVRDGFLLSGGMVLIQTGYEKATDHKIDGRASKGEAYCMATIGAECSPPKSAYVTDKAGNILFDKNGDPLVDVTKTDPIRPHVGIWAKKDETPLIGIGERSGSMTAVSRIPGMNAMALFHDNWAVTWDMNAFTSVTSIVPAVVLTYRPIRVLARRISTGSKRPRQRTSRKQKLRTDFMAARSQCRAANSLHFKALLHAPQRSESVQVVTVLKQVRFDLR